MLPVFQARIRFKTCVRANAHRPAGLRIDWGERAAKGAVAKWLYGTLHADLPLAITLGGLWEDLLYSLYREQPYPDAPTQQHIGRAIFKTYKHDNEREAAQ